MLDNCSETFKVLGANFNKMMNVYVSHPHPFNLCMNLTWFVVFFADD